MSVQAKFRCFAKNEAKEGETFGSVELAPVYSDDPNDPNKAFSDATPSGHIRMNIQKGKEAFNKFEVGKVFFVNFVEDISPIDQGAESKAGEGGTESTSASQN